MRCLGLVVALVAAPTLLWPADSARQPIRLFIFGSQTGVTEIADKAERKARERELEDRYTEAMNNRKDLEKQLKKQHGKKQDQWPDEAQAELDAAIEDLRTASFGFDFRDSTQEWIDKAVTFLRSELEGEELISLVPSAEEADLVVEVIAFTGNYRICYGVSPGARLDGSRVEGKDLRWKMDRQVESLVFASKWPAQRLEIKAEMLAQFRLKDALKEFVKNNNQILVAARFPD